MIFWTSFLVFLASMLIYLLLPARPDQIALDHYRDEHLMVSFVNQHQSAKNYIEQKIMWQDSNGSLTIHPFDTDSLAKFMPNAMKTNGGLYHDIGTQSQIDSDEDVFVSGIVCLDGSDNLSACSASTNAFVITYGYVPFWWDFNNIKRQGPQYDSRHQPIYNSNGYLEMSRVWLKPMLRLTHGSTACGTLANIGTDDDPVYAIDNGQTFKGYRVSPIKDQKMLPTTVADWLWDKLEKDRPILICMNEYKNPYTGTPAFHWDIANNTADNSHTDISIFGSSPILGTPLVGSFSGKTMYCDGDPCSYADYTISGTVKAHSTSTSTLIKLNGTDSISYDCDSVSCSVKVGSLTWDDIPLEKPFSFTYSRNADHEKLSISYTTCPPEGANGKCKIPTVSWESSDTTTAPVMNAPTIENANLVDIMIYGSGLSDSEVMHNNLANHKRFGI